MDKSELDLAIQGVSAEDRLNVWEERWNAQHAQPERRRIAARKLEEILGEEAAKLSLLIDTQQESRTDITEVERGSYGTK